MKKYALTLLLLLANLPLSADITAPIDSNTLNQKDTDLITTSPTATFIQLPDAIRAALDQVPEHHTDDIDAQHFLALKNTMQEGYTIVLYDRAYQGIENALEILSHHNAESMSTVQKTLTTYLEQLPYEQTINANDTRATQGSKLQYFQGDVIIQDTLKVSKLYADFGVIGNLPPGGRWPLLSVPWTNWQYFVGVLSGTTASGLWVPSSGINGTAYTGTPNRDFGTVTIDVEIAGTYSFSFAYQAQNNTGIATFVINGVTTSVDTYYPFSTVESFTWTQALGIGIYTIDLSSLTKNASSSDYWLQFIGDGLSIRRVA